VTSDRPKRTRATALQEIRSAEAARVLGLLDAIPLPRQAAQWISDGIDSGNVRALAGAETSGADPTPQILAELLGAVAREQGVTFHTLQDARKVHARSLIAMISNPAEFGPQVFGLSNTVTDEFAARIQRFLRRLGQRGTGS
jgi:hypothetical protein